MQISGKVALVTGGASGLGRAVVKTLVASNARTYSCDLSSSQGQAVAAELGAEFLALDVTSESEVTAALDQVQLNDNGPSILVNCAGIATAGLTCGPQGPHDYQTFKKTIDVNLNGVFNMVRKVAEVMMRNPPEDDGERGTIINTASIASTDGQRGQVAYASSKAGVAGSTLPLARDLATFGIRVNAVCPGIFDTPMLDEVNPAVRKKLARNVVFPKRLGDPKEFAQLVKFLIECPYINGENVRLDGALRMS